MPGSTRSWFISYHYQSVYRNIDGGFQFGPGTDAFEIIDVHPAKYIAKMRVEHNAWREGKKKMPGDRGPDWILRLWSAIPIAPSDITPTVTEAFE